MLLTHFLYETLKGKKLRKKALIKIIKFYSVFFFRIERYTTAEIKTIIATAINVIMAVLFTGLEVVSGVIDSVVCPLAGSSVGTWADSPPVVVAGVCSTGVLVGVEVAGVCDEDSFIPMAKVLKPEVVA